MSVAHVNVCNAKTFFKKKKIICSYYPWQCLWWEIGNCGYLLPSLILIILVFFVVLYMGGSRFTPILESEFLFLVHISSSLPSYFPSPLLLLFLNPDFIGWEYWRKKFLIDFQNFLLFMLKCFSLILNYFKCLVCDCKFFFFNLLIWYIIVMGFLMNHSCIPRDTLLDHNIDTTDFDLLFRIISIFIFAFHLYYSTRFCEVLGFLPNLEAAS